MRTNVCLSVGITLLSLSLGIYLVGQAWAGENKEVTDAVLKIAASIKKGDSAGAKTQAAALAKKIEALEEVMDALKPRKKGGVGVGKVGQVTPDGIELKLITLGRDAPTPAVLGKEAEALEEMAYVIAAVAEVTHVMAPAADKGKKTKKDWLAWTADMREGANKLAEAAKAKGAQDVKGAASKINAACNSCHSVFR
jgi:hypothetical protein